ncbi:MAG: UDP-2,3-diacylglucosamine diphosphatase [Deltaproteobacteria bacterium]|nr:UDP-2,3-diacylglucosamine diphosphatase [Deltaproteobacteria bacterium]
MKTIFIADAHISGINDPVQGSLSAFFSSLADQEKKDRPERIIILGDLFDFWVGLDKAIFSEYLPLLNALKTLADSGVSITYVEGNHDFFMGEYFTKTLGAKVIEDFGEITIDRKKIYISHGDSVDKTLGYAMWRFFIRGLPGRFLAKILPSGLSWKIGQALSSKSRSYNDDRSSRIERRLRAFAKRRLKSGYSAVVMAHSHSAVVSEDGEFEGGLYANPGSFADNGSHLTLENGKFKIEKFKI